MTTANHIENLWGVDAVMHEIGNLKAEVSGLRAEVGGLRSLLSESVISQQRDHGKRIRELDDRLTEMEISQATEQGKSLGGKAMVTMFFTIISAASGFAGAVISKLF